jgi:hypothetical protein
MIDLAVTLGLPVLARIENVLHVGTYSEEQDFLGRCANSIRPQDCRVIACPSAACCAQLEVERAEQDALMARAVPRTK